MIYYIIFIILLLIALWCCWKISVADLRRHIIPDAYLFPLLIIGIIVNAFFPWVCTIQDAAIGAAVGYILPLVIGLCFDYFRRRKNPKAQSPIGLGDIKLLGTGGFWLGTFGLAMALVLACIFGGIWSLYKKRKFIPFAPFFIIASFLSLITMVFLI